MNVVLCLVAAACLGKTSALALVGVFFFKDVLEPIRKEMNHDEVVVARRLSMMRIMARRMKATTVLA